MSTTSKHRYGSIPTSARRLRPGQRTIWVEARRNEDADAAIARVSARVWSPRIVGRPERVGHRWQFVVRRGDRP